MEVKRNEIELDSIEKKGKSISACKQYIQVYSCMSVAVKEVPYVRILNYK